MRFIETILMLFSGEIMMNSSLGENKKQVDSLSISYTDFNKIVFDALRDKSNASSYVSTILLDIPLPKKGKINDIPADWSDIIREKDGIPQYLGLIAIQVLIIATKPKETGYNDELSSYLGLNDLPKHYEENQKLLYGSFGEWCSRNMLFVYIPKERSGPWCYVRYPLSLSLINQQNSDLLKNCFFTCKFLKPGQYEFDEFWANVDGQIVFPATLQNKLNGPDRLLAEELKHQIYWHYLHWDGTGSNQIADPERQPNQRGYCPPKLYQMIWNENDAPSSAKFRENEEQIDITRLPDKIRSGCFFIQDEDYPDDWELCSPETIGADEDEGERLYAYVVMKAEDEYSPGELNIYTLKKSDILELIDKHANLFKKDPCIKLEGGIRFRYQKIWLEGCGPEICKLNGFSEQLRLEKYSEGKWEPCPLDDAEQPLIDLKEGAYRLWYSEMRLPIRFTIVAIERTDFYYRYPLGGGWRSCDHGHYSVASESELAEQGGTGIICGLDFSGVECPDEMRRCNPVRQWMDLVIGKNTIPGANENLIHKTLRRSENG